MNLTLTQINAAVDAAFQTSLAQTPPQKLASQAIGDNCTLRTDVYTGPRGTGFVVVAAVDLKWRKLSICKQHGPETQRELAAPTLESLLTECRAKREAAYPPYQDLLDGMAKQSSADAAVKSAGDAQVANYFAACLAVKAAFPKPQ